MYSTNIVVFFSFFSICLNYHYDGIQKNVTRPGKKMGNFFLKIDKFSDSMVLELTVDPRVLNTCSLLKEVEDFFFQN